jgi:hypothetical protein
MKRLFMSIGHWWFGKKKGVEVTTPLETPTMKVVKAEPQEDKVEAILNGNAPEPQFMPFVERDDMPIDEIVIGSNPFPEDVLNTTIKSRVYSPLKFDVLKDGVTFSLTKKQHILYNIIAKHDKISGINLCKEYLAIKFPDVIPDNLPKWQFDVYGAHKRTIAYLFKSGLVVKKGKFYSVSKTGKFYSAK